MPRDRTSWTKPRNKRLENRLTDDTDIRVIRYSFKMTVINLFKTILGKMENFTRE